MLQMTVLKQSVELRVPLAPELPNAAVQRMTAYILEYVDVPEKQNSKSGNFFLSLKELSVFDEYDGLEPSVYRNRHLLVEAAKTAYEDVVDTDENLVIPPLFEYFGPQTWQWLAPYFPAHKN